MADPQVQLNELTAECMVRLGRDLEDAPDEGGSGAWIAPGIILTCAHVVPGGVGSSVQVRWAGHTMNGIVTDQQPHGPGEGALWPFPDLAVVAVEDKNAKGHPCVRLSEAVPVDSARLVAFGHSAILNEGLRPTAVEGRMSGWHTFGDWRLWQFKENELCACRKPHPCSSSGMLVFVEDSAESVSSANVQVGDSFGVGDRNRDGPQWSRLCKGLVGSVLVVKLLVLA